MANEIQELKFQVGEAWKGVYSSSTAYGLANVVQDPTGLSIYRSLKPGNAGHPLSDTSWWFRIIDMSSIKAESDRIAALNEAIAQDEALRVAAEELRQQHEAERVAAETQRNEAEQARISAEQARVNAESARAIAEQQRITAEESRVSAESARVQAEQARVLAETLRANAEDQRAANEQNRIAAEQQRIERAEQDHQRAESDHATYVDSLGAFDISSYHATDGVLAKYADLTAALGANGANIPDDLRKGGMSVKFVQSSDNKYVQYHLTTDGWSANVAEWQNIYFHKKFGLQDTFELGHISGLGTNSWSYSDSTTGLITKQGTYLNLNGGDVIKCSDYAHVKMYIGCKGDYTKGSQGWITQDFVAAADGEYVILATYIVEQQVTVAELGSKFSVVKKLNDAAYYNIDDAPDYTGNLVKSKGVAKELNGLKSSTFKYNDVTLSNEYSGHYINDAGTLSSATGFSVYWMLYNPGDLLRVKYANVWPSFAAPTSWAIYDTNDISSIVSSNVIAQGTLCADMVANTFVDVFSNNKEVKLVCFSGYSTLIPIVQKLSSQTITDILNSNITALSNYIHDLIGDKSAVLTEIQYSVAETNKFIAKDGNVVTVPNDNYVYTSPVHLSAGLYWLQNVYGYNNQISLVSNYVDGGYVPFIVENTASDSQTHNTSSLFFCDEGDYVLSGNFDHTVKLVKITLATNILNWLQRLDSKEADLLQTVDIDLIRYNKKISTYQRCYMFADAILTETDKEWNASTKTKSDSPGIVVGYYPIKCSGTFDLSHMGLSGNNGGAFIKNISDTVAISCFPSRSSNLVVPAGANYIAINTTNSYSSSDYYYFNEDIYNNESQTLGVTNQWSGKKIAILGTSVAFGQLAHSAYAKIAANKLGAEIVPCCVPGLAIHGIMDDGMLIPKTYGSSSLTIEEYEAAYTAGKTTLVVDNTPIPVDGDHWEPGGAGNYYYISFENIFTQANKDVDLWIFAVGPNNNNFSTSDWDAFNKNEWRYNDDSSFASHRTTFLGALLFLMDKMYTLNPRARMCLLLDCDIQYSSAKTQFELLKSKWRIPIIDLWSKINTSPKSILQIYSEGGTNPHPSTFAHNIMGNALANELLLIG